MDMSPHAPLDGVNVFEAGFKGRSKLAGSTWPSYYGSYACHSGVVPEQSNQAKELNRTGLDRADSFLGTPPLASLIG